MLLFWAAMFVFVKADGRGWQSVRADPPRKLVLCADDFGLTEAVSEGILDLIVERRLTATSVFSQAPCWPRAARRLAQVLLAKGPGTPSVDVGLHLNLTHAFGIQPQHGWYSPPKDDPGNSPVYWWLASQSRLISRSRLTMRFRAQIDAFVRHFERLPDFIDSHQHVHAFPRIRQALTDAITARWPATRPLPWLRAPERLVDVADSPVKARLIQLASCRFSQHAARNGLRTPAGFAGVYSMRAEADFRHHMQRWLQAAPEGTLLVCHPARKGALAASTEVPDELATTRGLEYEYLSSSAFSRDCRATGVQLARFSELIATPATPVIAKAALSK